MQTTRRAGVRAVLAVTLAAVFACSGEHPATPEEQGVVVEVAPRQAGVMTNGVVTFASEVAGAADGAVTWSVSEAGGGTVDATGRYSAPGAPGTFHVVVTSQADATKTATATVTVQSPGGIYQLAADRATTWNPGVEADGALQLPLGLDRLPVRTTVCATLDAGAYANGVSDATAAINAALAACPSGQVVQLSPGDFLINAGIVTIARSGVVLRGAGAGQTRLVRTNGARPGSSAPTAAMPVVVIGADRWPKANSAASQNLTADGAKGSTSVTLANAAAFSAGQLVLLDEETRGAWSPLPDRNGAPTSTRIWKGDRVVWQFHDPHEGEDDPLVVGAGGKLGTGSDAATWFSRQDRPITEVKEIASVSGSVVTFTSPLHIDYRVSHVAQVTPYVKPAVQYSGVEALSVVGGDDGNFRFENVARCWARNVENTAWLGEGFAIDHSFRVVIRDSYIHDGAWPEPGGGGYAISFARGSSEVLVENNISMNVNKVMVARCSGAGSVIGYNYTDNGFIRSNGNWVEVGINGSHMVGPHHMLFEGNYSFNADSDSTHGSSISHTFFRNHLSGKRLGGTFLGTTLVDSSNVRCAGASYGSRWMSFVGNVLGVPGQMSGWIYENLGDGAHGSTSNPWGGNKSVWIIGLDPIHWEQVGDPDVISTIVRDGNYDYVTNAVHWHSTPGFSGALPASMYLAGKPAFFGDRAWPWVDPLGATKVAVLPAKARYEAGTPNVLP